MVHPSGFEPETARLEGGCSIQLSYECIYNNNLYGTPERTRTPNPQIRSLMLYPVEPLALLWVVFFLHTTTNGVGDGARTRDNLCHKQVLYQLNYAYHQLLYYYIKFLNIMVGVKGLEPSTPWSQTRCATRLRYTPKSCLLDAIHLKKECNYNQKV